MSMLSDYQRMVEKPRIASYEATIKSLREEVARLQKALMRSEVSQ